uniref:Uncharacterized protein n=1 Tax=Arundo donax TaxID=35708 RepID=A0A0A9CDS3_ARUDO
MPPPPPPLRRRCFPPQLFFLATLPPVAASLLRPRLRRSAVASSALPSPPSSVFPLLFRLRISNGKILYPLSSLICPSLLRLPSHNMVCKSYSSRRGGC